MATQTRRGLLAATASALALAAGCLSEEGADPARGGTDDADSSGEGGDSGNESAGSDDATDDDADPADDEDADDEDDAATIDAGNGLAEAEVVRYDHGGYPDEPRIEFLASADGARAWVEDHEFAGEESAVAEALEDTDFAEAVAVVVEAGARDLCHRLEVREVSSDDGTLSVEAAVEKDPGAGDVCAQQMTAVGAVVRAIAADDPPSAATVTVVDDDGRAHEVVVGTDRDDE
ncbi:hypothetical protein [Halovivax sp.]|uniref:hypothetical protein n=1 Tax=Halovivax sp. TaxID=1935978 RepID=UPI0025C04224|nr:hypothetical protein [Halovivax sp.]